MPDTLQRFLFEQANVRGELVQLDASWQAVLERHDYPAAVREMLGQAMVSATLLAATMKFTGSITLQIRGNGPISMLIADCSPQHVEGADNPLYHLRGMANWEGEVGNGDLASRFGDGQLVITIDPGTGSKRYQGIVELSGNSLADAIDDYLLRSEQLPTRMWLAADAHHAAGLLLQRLPGSPGDEDSWRRLGMLAETLTTPELLELSADTLLHRLFHEEELRVFDPQPVVFHCHCSRERLTNALLSIGYEEVMDIIREQGKIDATCQFCNRAYHFDAVDAEQIFTTSHQAALSPTRH